MDERTHLLPQAPSDEPIVTSLGNLPLNVHALRNSRAGRTLLERAGKWGEDEEALRLIKQRGRDKTRTRNRDYMKRKEQKKTIRRSKAHTAPFIGWDGEGLTTDRHRYVMLCNSLGEALVNPLGLTTQECIRFLLQRSKETPFANHVVFGGSYDANMLLYDLSYDQIVELATTGSVWFHNYKVTYRPRKYLRIIEAAEPRFIKNKKGEWSINRVAAITLWDVWGFFQSSFVKAIQVWTPGLTAALEFIERMKANRSTFALDDMDEMKRYCIEECNLLVAQMNEVREQCRYAGIVPKRWDGAGALGSRMLEKEGVKRFMPPLDSAAWQMINELAQYAYFGGRIEMVRYGIAGQTVYGHDIVSAYPSAMVQLPCLAHGEWVRNELGHMHLSSTPMLPRTPFTLCHVRFKALSERPFYPLPWRNRHKLIFFPPETEGWYWLPEVKNLNPAEYELVETYSWHPSCSHQPFSFVREKFDFRQRLKRAGHPAEKVLKLALNSLYGKLAQQVGGVMGKIPPYHQLCWAGFITSVTRARMYRLAMEFPDDVIAFETDGLYSTKNHLRGDANPIPNLGEWEITSYTNLIYVQSGIYFSKQGEEWARRYRGLDPGTLEHTDVLNAWLRGVRSLTATSTRFRGLYTSAVSPERFIDWHEWITENKEIALYPKGKRMDMRMREHPDNPHYIPEPHKGLQRTFAIGGGSFSTKHALRWIDQENLKTIDDQNYLDEMEYEESDDA